MSGKCCKCGKEAKFYNEWRYADKMFGVHKVALQKEFNSNNLYDLSKIISRASLEEDYKTLYEALWPYVKSVYKKHYGDLLNSKLLYNIRFELDHIYNTATQYVHPVCLGIVNLAFKSCIHSAEQWNFSIEE